MPFKIVRNDITRVGQVLYALAHSSLKPEFSIEYTVADVEKCKNELLHKAIEDFVQKAQVLTTAANWEKVLMLFINQVNGTRMTILIRC